MRGSYLPCHRPLFTASHPGILSVRHVPAYLLLYGCGCNHCCHSPASVLPGRHPVPAPDLAFPHAWEPVPTVSSGRGRQARTSTASARPPLGWFRYTTVSAGNGVATKEEVSSDQITGLRVQFTPDRTRNMSGGYTRALIADEGITFMEWLGKESDETQVPEDDEAEVGNEGSFG